MPPKPPSMPMREARAALARREPRFPLDRVAEYAALYDYEEDNLDIEAIAAGVRPQGYFRKRDFRKTVQWKSRRSAGYARRNAARDVQAVTQLAFSSTDERLRINLLRALQGVDWPVASALLYVGCDATYPILDWRALWALNSGEPPAYSFAFWEDYVACCRELAHDANVDSVRQLDKALWK